MNSKIYILTSGYPFGNSEPFLSMELEYVSRSFDEVVILVSNKFETTEKRIVPLNCSIVFIEEDINKFAFFHSFFTLIFWRELIYVRRKYNKKISIGILKTALVSLSIAKKIKNEIINQSLITDNIHFYSYWSDDKAIALALLKKDFPRMKMFSRIHGWDVYFNVSKFNYLPYRSLLSKRINKIFSVSQKGIEEVTGVWKQESRNFFLARLGVEKQDAEISVSSDDFRLVSCSNLIPLKRVHLIIDALSLLGGRNIEWVHFGDGVEFKKLKEKSKKISPKINIIWKGRVKNSEVINYYKENYVTCFINVSSSEGVPVSIMEAMSFGIPVIATNVGGTSEIVKNKNGVLLSSNPTKEEIALEIENFFNLSDSDIFLKREEAYRTWKTKFNAEKNYSEFAEIISNL